MFQNYLKDNILYYKKILTKFSSHNIFEVSFDFDKGPDIIKRGFYSHVRILSLTII